jgi:glycosyltransferase involved in cell wall biosynthesis
MCLLEAMAAGKPVIATRVGAVPKMVKAGETGLLLERGDVAGLSSGITRILRDKELARRLGENAQAYVSQCFSAEAMAKSYVAQYQGLLDSRRNGSRNEAAWEVS